MKKTKLLIYIIIAIIVCAGIISYYFYENSKYDPNASCYDNWIRTGECPADKCGFGCPQPSDMPTVTCEALSCIDK